MVAPDYQEFANHPDMVTRDNTVIYGVARPQTIRNQPSVAPLPRWPPAKNGTFKPMLGREAPLAARVFVGNDALTPETRLW